MCCNISFKCCWNTKDRNKWTHPAMLICSRSFYQNMNLKARMSFCHHSRIEISIASLEKILIRYLHSKVLNELIWLSVRFKISSGFRVQDWPWAVNCDCDWYKTYVETERITSNFFVILLQNSSIIYIVNERRIEIVNELHFHQLFFYLLP